jgi:hypothetical protein
MALRHRVVAEGVDTKPPLHSRTREQGLPPARHVRVAWESEEVVGFVEAGEGEDPGEDGHVRDAVFIPNNELFVGEVLVENVELALRLHGEAVNGVLDVDGRIDVEVAEAASNKRCAGRRTGIGQLCAPGLVK